MGVQRCCPVRPVVRVLSCEFSDPQVQVDACKADLDTAVAKVSLPWTCLLGMGGVEVL